MTTSIVALNIGGVYTGLKTHNFGHIENPRDPPQITQYTMNLTNANQFLIDLSLRQSLTAVPVPQTIFIDNSQVAVSTTVLVQSTGQLIVCAPYSQQFTPIFCTDSTRLVVTNQNGSQYVNLWLCNFPVQPGAWTTANPIINVGGQLISTSTEGQRPTYQGNAGILLATGASSGGGIFPVAIITGSANKTIRIKRIAVQGWDKTNANAVTIYKTSAYTLNAGSTYVPGSIIKFDSINDPAYTSNMSYTRPPSGSYVNPFFSSVTWIPFDSYNIAVNDPSIHETVFATRNDKALILNGVQEAVVVTFGQIYTSVGYGAIIEREEI